MSRQSRLYNWVHELAYRTMRQSIYDARCRRENAGYGFRWLGIDWFKL